MRSLNLKRANLGFIAMMLALMLVSACQEQGPRLRPLISPSAVAEPEPEPEPEEITRPNGAVFIKNDFCACNNGKSAIFSGSTCTNFCANKQTSGNDILYLNFTVSDAIISQGFQSTAGWCSLQINESDNVRCVLSVRSESGNEPSIDVVLNSANSFTANISSLAMSMQQQAHPLMMQQQSPYYMPGSFNFGMPGVMDGNRSQVEFGNMQTQAPVGQILPAQAQQAPMVQAGIAPQMFN